jgi:predicted amidohydrolase
MANRIKISCVAPSALRLDADLTAEEAVQQMIAHWREQLSRVLPDRPDIIVLPEACDRPDKKSFPAEERREYYAARGNRIRDVFSEIAKENRCYIVYASHLQLPDGTWRNSAQFIDRNGGIAGTYHKNHLVIEENTDNSILYGTEAPIIECDFGRVACAICFDLNFDALRERYMKEQPDLIVFPSMYHGGFMQKTWAYTCRSHFAGAVCGLPSSVLSPVGEIVSSSTNYYPFVTATVNLDCKVIHIDHNHIKFPDIKRKYGEKVRIFDPGFLGPVLISSETDEFTVQAILEEFNLETIDAYFDRSLAHREQNVLS